MLNTLTILALAAAAPLASAFGSARVVNRCSAPVTLWSVGQNIAGPFTLAAGTGSYAEEFTRDPVTGGKALKITKTADGLYTGQPQTIFAYSLINDGVYYDLSDVFGDAFAGSRLVEASADASCPVIDWPNGTPPAGSQVKVCTAEKDITLTLCA